MCYKKRPCCDQKNMEWESILVKLLKKNNMKIDYEKLIDLNKRCVITSNNNTTELSCFWVIQKCVENFMLGELLTQKQTDLLVSTGILVMTEDEINSKTIVGPFKFSDNGSKIS